MPYRRISPYWLNISVSIGLTMFATSFSLTNTALVHISFLGLTSDDVPLFVPIFVAFVIGFSAGLLALSFSRRKHKIEIKKLRKENKLLYEEVENLRNIPLQDDL